MKRNYWKLLNKKYNKTLIDKSTVVVATPQTDKLLNAKIVNGEYVIPANVMKNISVLEAYVLDALGDEHLLMQIKSSKKNEWGKNLTIRLPEEAIIKIHK